MRYKRSYLKIILLIFILSPWLYEAHAIDNYRQIEDCSVISEKYNQLNESYWKLMKEYDKLNNSYYSLLKEYQKVKEEKEYYKQLYENSSIGKISVRDFYLTIDKIIYMYNTTFQNLENNINNQIKRYTLIYIPIIVTIIVTIEIILFSLTIYFIFIKYKKFMNHNEENKDTIKRNTKRT